MLEDTATMMRPPPRPLNMDGESLSTRALNKMYRESRGEAFFSNAPVVSPSGSSTSVPTATSPNLSWLNHPPLPSTSSLSHNHAFRPRQTQNTRSRSEQSIASVQSDSSRRRYHGGHSDDRPSSRVRSSFSDCFCFYTVAFLGSNFDFCFSLPVIEFSA